MKWPDFFIVGKNGVFYIKDKHLHPCFHLVRDNRFLGVDIYGLTWSDKCFYLSEDKTLLRLEGGMESYTKIDIGHNLKDTHQILWVNNKLYIVNTKYDQVVVVDTVQKPLKVTKVVTLDKNCHVNSVFHYKNRFYVCCHNLTEPSFISVFDNNFDYLTKIENVGYQNHNIYIKDNTLYSLSSKDGFVFQYNLDTQDKKTTKLVFRDSDEFYLRGLAKNHNYFVVGASVREPERTKRSVAHHERNAKILLLNNDLEVVDEMIVFEHEIKEIRIINEPDLAHH